MPKTTLNPKPGSPHPSSHATALLCSHLTRIHSASREFPEQDALLEEISRTGAVVSVACPLKTGSAVKIDCRTCELRGKVIGCKHGYQEYKVEIAFPKDQPWHPPEFKPESLLNPNYLVCENPDCTPDCVGGSCENVEAQAERNKASQSENATSAGRS